MRLKLIVALVDDDKTEVVIEAARDSGATGATIVNSVRGEGLVPDRTFFGLGLAARRNIIMFIVVEPRARDILERIADAAQFDIEQGAGIAFQIDIEDAVGLVSQMPAIHRELELEI